MLGDSFVRENDSLKPLSLSALDAMVDSLSHHERRELLESLLIGIVQAPDQVQDTLKAYVGNWRFQQIIEYTTAEGDEQ